MYGFPHPKRFSQRFRQRSRQRFRRGVAVVTALATVAASLVAQPAQAAAPDAGRPEVNSAERVVRGETLGVKPRRPDPAGTPATRPRPSGEVKVTSPGAVRMIDRAAAERAGVDGALFTLAPAENTAAKDTPTKDSAAKDSAAKDVAAGGTTSVTVDYSALADDFGGSYGSRLRLVRLPACALTTPDQPACRTETPVRARNDAAKGTLTATIPAAPEAGTAALAGEQATVLAAVSGDSSDKGDYKATKLSPSATWTVAEQSGDFSWSYPLRVPPVPGELTPKVEIGYSSGAVDGRTSNTNNQPSWVGEGFDYWPGYIKRAYKPCADDGAPKDQWGTPPGDQCWAYDNAVISWNGRGGELIQASDGTWRMKNDDGTRVERLKDTAKANGDDDGEYWKLTTPDGVQFFFGLNRLPGWSSGKPETKSAWTHPVFGDDAGEPCHASTFAASWCQQAYQWNLDYVVDPRGNAITYYYQQEGNHYGRNLKPEDETPYVRGGWLDRIEYGQRSDTLFTAKAPARVVFGVSERCLKTDAFDCDPSKIGSNPTKWPDVPYDLNCTAGTECKATHGTLAPTFWSRKRLTGVTTQVIKADGGYRDVDNWTLDHLWGDADIDQALLVKSIAHTGRATGSPVTLPSVTFNHVQLPNRVDKQGDDIPPFVKYRLGAVYDESGGQIDVNYSDADCALGSLPTPETNTRRCFPVKWTPAGYEDPITDWFHKYVVTQVVQSDRTGGSPDALTTYEYLDGAAWHYDDDDGMTKEKYKTWSQWRGYGRVRVRTGGWNDLRSQVETRYLRGMNGDRAGPGGGTKKVTVSDGEGGSAVDEDPLQGFELKRTEYEGVDGAVAVKTVNTPWYQETAKRTRSWGTVTANIVNVAKTHTWTAMDGGGWRETESATKYEPVAGLTTQVDDKGDLSTTADDRCTRTTYAQNTGAWMLRYPSRVETVAVACSATPDRSKQVVEDDRTFYDNGAFGAAPTKGDITRVETIAAHDGTTATYVAKEISTYDAYGRELTTKNAAGHVTTTAYTDTGGLNTGVKVTGPPVVPGDSSTAHVTSQEKDPAYGFETVKIDANGKRTDLEYDALGRLLKVWMPDRSKAASQTPNLEFGYRIVDGEIVAIATKKLDAEGGQTPPTYELYDGRLRLRQTQEPGPDGGRLVSDKFYDSRGNVAREYGQYYSTAAPSTKLFGAYDGDVESQKVFDYDGRNRVTLERFLVGNGETKEKWRTVTSYGGGRVTVDPPTGDTPVTTLTDARDQIVELRQYKGDSPTGDYDKTTYTYTPAGKLSTVKDPAGNVWTHFHDLRGREIEVRDPDKGTTKTTYDDLDHVLTTTDARGKKIFNVYDSMGRRTETREGSATGPLMASWTYDTVRKGQASSATRYVSGQAYTTTFNAYDNLYRAIRTTVTIPSAEGALAGSYVFDTRYKLDGTVQSATYPDAGGLPAETVVYSYDDLRRPTTMSGLSPYVTDSIHSLTGKPEQYELSTGGKKTWFTYSYEYGTQRLHSSRVDREDVPGVDRDATYTYDAVGNVVSISDVSRGGTDTQCFGYDYLRRLTEAWTQGTRSCAGTPSASVIGGVAPYWQSFGYDVTGNRTKEVEHGVGGAADTTRAYDYPAPGSPHPHALSGVTQTGGAGARTESYAYDETGNTTGRTIGATAQTLEWDVEGHLAKVTEGTKVTSYLYDADGNRLVRRDPGGTTLYLPGLELRLDKATAKVQATRYYTHDTVTVAVRTTAGVKFLAADQNGTAELAIDAANQSLTQRRFKPFGQLRGSPPGSWPGEKGFVGGTVDDSTGLTHLGAREYDPATGRFISVDPIIDPHDPQQMNGYAYAGNNPVTFTDPDGKFWGSWLAIMLALLRALLAVLNHGGGGGGGNHHGGGGGGSHGGGGGYTGGGGGAPHRSGPSFGSTVKSNTLASVDPRKFTALGWLAYGLGGPADMLNTWGENFKESRRVMAGLYKLKSVSYPEGNWLTKWLWKGLSKWYDAKANRIEARGIKWGGRLGKAGKFVGRFGVVATFADGALTQWNSDSGKDVNTGEKIARATIRGAAVAGGSYAGATIGAAACSPGVVLAAVCGAAGAYIGGMVGGVVGDTAIAAYDHMRKPVVNTVKSVGSGIKKGWKSLFG
ncbi:RHS repeat-associated core domain-containing protein [Microbispora sp. H10836]|uniref:RHS repeat-associated core domain-containing protein n=1 Tax=Microbispora sp. H10836 TaxID=2729106 RepID=UPI001475050B|nr:RHS repeat-associated core domain-containing protein [Microbispora sp. H10836]